jgi:hypothetical protein
MSHTLILSDSAYRAIAAAAASRGQTPEAYLEAWASALERDPDQAWFWRPEWQAGERAADEDLVAGRATRYESDEAFLQTLKDRSKHADV